MPFIELKCKKCGHEFEELTRPGEYPRCPKCGGETEQKYSGKLYAANVRKGGCTGNCKTCGGCK